jgi:hypothetical protein
MVKAWFRRCRRSVPGALTLGAAAPRSDAPSFEEKARNGRSIPVTTEQYCRHNRQQGSDRPDSSQRLRGFMTRKDRVARYGRLGLILMAFAMIGGVVAEPLLRPLLAARLTIAQR